MSDQEKARIVEERLPSIQAIFDAYKAQGKALTQEEAEQIRQQIRADMTSGHIDAMENLLSDKLLDKVSGGCCYPHKGSEEPHLELN